MTVEATNRKMSVLYLPNVDQILIWLNKKAAVDEFEQSDVI